MCIYIIGAGTYGQVIAELAESVGYVVKGFYDDNTEKIGEDIYKGASVVGSIKELLSESKKSDDNYAIALGNNKLRSDISQVLLSKNFNFPCLVHPSAVISPSAKVGKGCFVHSLTYLWSYVEVSDFCIISPNSTIAHHTTLGESCFVSTGSNVGASINLRSESFIGIGSTIMTGVKEIGRGTFIGAGAVVIKDAPDYSVVVGNPGRVIKYNYPKELC